MEFNSGGNIGRVSGFRGGLNPLTPHPTRFHGHFCIYMCSNGAATTRMTALSITTLVAEIEKVRLNITIPSVTMLMVMALSITTLMIETFSITTLRIKTLSITTLRIEILSIMTLRITILKIASKL
jgi:hypothetical protein